MSKAAKKFRWALLAILLVCLMPLLAHALNSWHYATSDEIEKAKINTENILTRYQKTGDAKEMQNWIIHGPTEAPGTQANLTFGRWALQYPNEFVSIVQGLPQIQQETFIESFCNSLNQSSLGNDFKAVFKNSRSKIATAILQKLA
jgi:hypothetical protein